MLQTVTPNLYQLHGHHLQLTYSTPSLGSVDGHPTLTYQDAHQGRSFTGNEIRAVECELGMLVSVTIRMTVDTGHTSFSLLIPRMRIAQGTSAPMYTDGVTTVHSLTILPQLSQGQLDTYTIMALQGTAQFVAS